MNLIQPSDPLYFKQTSDEPYDRHQYRLDFEEDKSIIFDDYEQMRSFWFEKIRNWHECTVTILDKDVQKKSRNTKGFGN